MHIILKIDYINSNDCKKLLMNAVWRCKGWKRCAAREALNFKLAARCSPHERAVFQRLLDLCQALKQHAEEDADERTLWTSRSDGPPAAAPGVSLGVRQ